MKKKTFLSLLCLFLGLSLFAQKKNPVRADTVSAKDTVAHYYPNPLVAIDPLSQKHWVDSTYQTMSLKEKVGQLFMPMIFSNNPKEVFEKTKVLIKKYHIGGIIFSKGGPVRQANLTNEFQKIAKVPLLIGQDAEWGLAMRLDSTFAFPWNMTLGAIENNGLIKRVGAQIGRQCRRIGVNINFAPVVDINTNPQNPIIGNRSFGEDRENVTQKAIAFMRGMESQGVLACAKHFPGHGDTSVDSHKSLPVVGFSKERLDSIELYPYEKIIPMGISSVMVSHLEVPALDPRPHHPASLSRPIIQGVLKDQLHFKGLIITDALNMKGVTNYDQPGKTSLDAFLAGNDVLLIPRSIPLGIKKIVEAYKAGVVTDERLEHSVKKILMAKYKAGLNHFEPIDTTFLVQDLNSIHNDLLYAELIKNAITVVKNEYNILPVKHLEKKKIAYVPMGDVDGTAFYNTLKKYDKVDKIQADHLGDLMEKLKPYNYVIVGFHKSNANPWKGYKFDDEELVWLNEIAREHHTVLAIFTRPYALLDFRTTANIEGIVIGYQNSKGAQQKTAQVIFGAIGAKGKLPVSAGKDFPVGTQIITKPMNRLSYGIPESVGMSSAMLKKIDSIAHLAIAQKMTPGMQVLVARKGKVIFQKSYGSPTYQNKRPVTNDDLYDLASLTKILATTPLLMELYQKGEIHLTDTLGALLPHLLKGTDKSDKTLMKVLSHYAGFEAWIPFYKETLDENGYPSPKYYRKKPGPIFSVKVAENLYLRKDYQDTIYKIIADSPLLPREKYEYSGLPFYLFKKYLEAYYGKNMNDLTQHHFYQSLGANHLGYLPLERFDTLQIMPAEIDDYFRHQILRGDVDDEGAAMFGGICGNAGLFSNANDVAKMMQMYLNGGSYGGVHYFTPQTVNIFNTCYFCADDVRRGLGFDKPQLSGPGPTFLGISRKSFGHTGFTGTIAWADPDEQIVYVCLSNRTYPDRSDRKFISRNIRTWIQRIIYRAIIIPNNDY